METKQVTVILAAEDLTKLMEIVGKTVQNDALRAAVIAFLQQHGVEPMSIHVKHGSDRKSGKTQE